MAMLDIIKVLDRTQNGEYCPVKEWDVKRIPQKVREKLKEIQSRKNS